jgi:acyl carrier protein phosphodiesterase
VYKILEARYELLPDRTKRLLPFLTSQNWLLAYANFNGLNAVFQGMDRRTGLQSGMSNAVPVLLENYNAIKEDFLNYYPKLEKFTKEEIALLYRDDQV